MKNFKFQLLSFLIYTRLSSIMRERKCFRCGKVLDFESFIKNCDPKSEEYFIKIWNSKYIEFYCCHCYCFKTKYQPYVDLE